MPERASAALFAEIGADTAPLERALSNAERSMQRTSQAWSRAAGQMESRTALLSQKYKELEQRNKELERVTLRVGAAFTAVGAAGGALIGTSTQLAARVETLGVVTATLGRNVGYSEQQIRRLEQSVVSQGITLGKSREAIALMIQANLDLANATKLARLAQDAAVIAGENSSETFQKLIYVIASGNILMARRMGLLVDFQGAYEREAEALGISTDALDENQKLQIRVNEVMSKGVNIAGAYENAMETAGKKVASLDRHIEESRRILGEVWLPTYAAAVDFITESLQAWESLDEAAQRNASTMLGYGTAIAAANGFALGSVAVFLKLRSAATVAATALGLASAKALALTAIPVVAAVSAWTVALIKLAGFLKQVREGLEAIDSAIDEHSRDVIRTTSDYSEYVKEIERMGRVTGKAVMTQERANELIEAGGRAAHYGRDAIILLTEEEFRLERASMAVTQRVKEMSEAVRGIGPAVTAAREAMKGMSEDAFSGALETLNLAIEDPLGGLVESFRDKQADLIEEAARLRDAISDLEGRPLTERGRAELQELQRELGNTKAAILENARAHEHETAVALFGILQQRIAQMQLTDEQRQAAFTMLNNVAHAWGIIGDQTFQALNAIDAALGAFAQGNVKAAQQEILNIGRAAMAVEGDYYIRFHVLVDKLGAEKAARIRATTQSQKIDDLINQSFAPGTFSGLKGTGGLVQNAKKAKEEVKKSAAEVALELAGAMSQIGSTAASIIKEQTIEPLKKQVEDIDKLLSPDHVDMLARERSAELEKQRADAIAKIAEEEQKILALQKAQQNLRLVEQQMRLLDIIKENKLNAKEILGGMKLGINAEMGDVIVAMTKAINELVSKAEKELGISSPSRIAQKQMELFMRGYEVQAMRGAERLRGVADTIATSIIPMSLPGGVLVGPPIDDRQGTQSSAREGDVIINVSADILSDRSKVRDLARMLGEEYKRNR